MRFSVTMPDDLVTTMDHQAEEQGISRVEYIRQACQVYTTYDERGAPPQEVTQLQNELQHKDQVIDMQRDEISWLRGEVAKLNDKIPLLTAPGHKPWWQIWK